MASYVLKNIIGDKKNTFKCKTRKHCTFYYLRAISFSDPGLLASSLFFSVAEQVLCP